MKSGKFQRIQLMFEGGHLFKIGFILFVLVRYFVDEWRSHMFLSLLPLFQRLLDVLSPPDRHTGDSRKGEAEVRNCRVEKVFKGLAKNSNMSTIMGVCANGQD